MRLFVGLAISQELRESLASLIQGLRQADSSPRWVNPANLHVTLKFIGEVPQEKLAPITEALTAVHITEPLELQLRGLGFFPNARRPAVAWVGMEPAEPLARLACEIDRSLAAVGIQREERPFVPHLTIARFKHTRVSPTLAEQIEKQKTRILGSLAVTEFHLIESKLKSSGAEYTTLRSFPFANR
jgi:2'-5' RNA ligase